jgi:acyl-CoA thioesterase
MAARIIGRAAVDAGYLTVAWPSGEDGRKLYAGTALFTESGALVAAARQTWIVLA